MLSLLVLMASFLISTTNYICPTHCSCFYLTVACIRTNLTRIPTNLHDQIIAFYFQRNDVYIIRGKLFGRYRQLTTIDLRYNRISYLERYAFENLTNLVTLDLSFNLIREILPKTFVGLSK